MKITFFLAHHNPFPGAAWVRISYFARYFGKAGHDVTIIGSCLRPHKPNSMWWEGVRILNICPVLLIQPMFLYIIDILLTIFLLPYFLICKPDIIVISTPPFAPCVGVHLISKLVGLKIIMDVRDLDVYTSSVKIVMNRTFKTMMENMYKNSDATIAVTNFIQGNLRSRGVENISVITNGADIETFKSIGDQKTIVRKMNNFDKDDFVIVYSGRIDYYHKLDTVIETVLRLKNKKIKLLIIGEGSEKMRLMKLVNEYGLQDRVKFIGGIVDTKKLSQLLGMCTVGILPTNRPAVAMALPTKVFEYAACHLPTIVMMAKHGVWSEIITSWNAGIIVPPLDVDVLKKGINYLFCSDKDREIMGKNARSMVEKHFSREAKSEMLEQLVELVTQ